MALNIKDPEVNRLATELAALLGTSKTGAIRHALNAQLARLPAETGRCGDALLDVVRTEILPLLSDRTPISKREREEILGYEPAAGV